VDLKALLNFLNDKDQELVLTNFVPNKVRNKIRATDQNGLTHAMWKKNLSNAIKDDTVTIDDKADTVIIPGGTYTNIDGMLVVFDQTRRQQADDWGD